MKKLIFLILFFLFLHYQLAYAQFEGSSGPFPGPGGLGGGTECSTAACDLDAATTLNTQVICLADGTDCPAGGGGDSVTVNTTAIDTTANIKDTASVTWAIVDGGAGGPDDIQATAILANAATALAANPADCGANTFANAIAASGALTCAEVPLGTATSGNYVSSATATGGLTLTGTEGASLGMTPCTGNEGYIQKWNAATGWTCQADAGGAETNSLETVITGIADDEIPIGSAADDSVYTALPDCHGNGSALNYDTTLNALSCKTLASADIPDLSSIYLPVIYEGTVDEFETTFAVTDPTTPDKIITFPNATGTVAISASAPATLSAAGDIGVTVLKDIVTTAPLTGGTNDVLPGADADITIAIPQATTSADGYVVQADWDSWTDHVANNTQAHSDYVVNTGDTITGAVTINDNNAAGSTLLTIGDATDADSVAIFGDLTVTGGDITLGASAILSGGDTTSLNLIDGIDATTETTVEGALDIAGEVTSTGMSTTVVADSLTVTGWALGNSTATTLNKLTLTTPATGSTLTLIDGKTLTVTNTVDLAATVTDEQVCNYEGTGTQINCDIAIDATTACAAGSICGGGHTHGFADVPHHLSATFDPSGMYDQETTYRIVHLMTIPTGGITITKWAVNYVGGDPTTELDADIVCDTTPDWNPAAGATVMDVIDTTAGASTANAGFDSATCAAASELYIRFGADPTDANEMLAFELDF